MSAAFINNGSLLFSGIWAFCETIVIFTLVFKFFAKILKRLDRIEYALYNDGKTGLINKVEELLDNQQVIGVKVAVIEAKVEQ